MTASPAPESSDSARKRWLWLRERLFPRGTNLIQTTSYVIVIALIILYVL